MLDELNEHYLEEARSRSGNNDILQLDIYSRMATTLMLEEDYVNRS